MFHKLGKIKLHPNKIHNQVLIKLKKINKMINH